MGEEENLKKKSNHISKLQYIFTFGSFSVSAWVMACLGSRMTISWRYQYGWKIRILPEVLPKLLMVMQKKEKRRKRVKLFWLRLKLLLSVVCDSRLRKYSCLKIWLKVSLSPLTPIPIPDFRTPTGLVLADFPTINSYTALLPCWTERVLLQAR